MSPGIVPISLSRHDDALEVVWREGESPQRLPARTLRVACPCATCQDEMTGRRLLDPATVPGDISLTGLELVGNYGVRLRWSDGHHTGIFTYQVLAEMSVND